MAGKDEATPSKAEQARIEKEVAAQVAVAKEDMKIQKSRLKTIRVVGFILLAGGALGRIAEEASRRMKADLDGFIRDSVASMREETARLASEVLATIDGSENGVHQRTLNRLTTFIDSFRSLNFAGDQQLESTLEKFRRDLLTRSAEDYRNDSSAMSSLTDGLARLRENAVQLARSDAREVLARFGQLGARKLAAAS